MKPNTKHLFAVLVGVYCLSTFFLTLTAQNSFPDVAFEVGVGNGGKNFGVAFGDYDNDGWEDVYISRHNGANLLYQNQGDGTFIDRATVAGVSYSGDTRTAIWGDVDNDGDLDLYLGNTNESNRLYENNGNGTFNDISATANVESIGEVRAALFGDVDKDGFLDIYVANINTANYLYHNNGDNTFTDITNASNTQDFQIAMGAVFFDYDNDRDLDLYLTHDAYQPCLLLQNDGTGYFTDVSVESGTNVEVQGMGVDFGDMNNDGHLDLYITNLLYNVTLLNNGDGTFTNVSDQTDTNNPGMGWGTTWLDYDNDGWQDIYLANDSYFSPFPNILYRNYGNNGFVEVSVGSSLASMQGSYGVATADYNRDGRIDILVANNNGIGNDRNQLFENNVSNSNNWVQVKTIGTESNRSGIGTRVEVEANGQTMVDEVCAGSGYASQNSLILHFGIGTANTIDRITVAWQSGITDIYENLSPNESYTMTEGENWVLTNTPPAIGEEHDFEMLNVYPNPFQTTSTIAVSFSKPQIDFLGTSVISQANIYNPQGQHIKTLMRSNSILEQANNAFSLEWVWNGTTDSGKMVASGLYYVRITNTNNQQIYSQSILFLKE